MQKWSCRWSRRAGVWIFFFLVCMFGTCSGKFLWLCINSSTLVGLGWPILRLPNNVDFGESHICRLGFELKIHEWALKTCNLIASLPPLSPCGEKPSLAVEKRKFVHLILCELFITLGRGSDPKNAISGLLLLSKKLPKIALSQLVR